MRELRVSPICVHRSLPLRGSFPSSLRNHPPHTLARLTPARPSSLSLISVNNFAVGRNPRHPLCGSLCQRGAGTVVLPQQVDVLGAQPQWTAFSGQPGSQRLRRRMIGRRCGKRWQATGSGARTLAESSDRTTKTKKGGRYSSCQNCCF
jgi:hypothetical protein